MILDTIIEQAKKVGLDKYISGEQAFLKIIENRGHKYNQIGRESLTIQLPTSITDDQFDKIKGVVQSVRSKQNQDLEVEYQRKLGVGTALPTFPDISKVFEQGTVQLSAKQGQVLLIDVWATWCGPCQKPMAHNQQMLQKNNWGDKVRIVAVSVDDEVQSVKQRVQSKGWKKIQHFTIGGWKHDHKLIKSFAISGIPFVCLVDKSGKINFSGHPSSIDLEQRINQLINEQGSQAQASKEHEKALSKEEAHKISKTIGNKQFFMENFGKNQFISTKIQLFETASNGNVSSKAEIQVYVRQQNKNLLQEYKKLLPSNIKFEAKLTKQVDVPEVPQGCVECKSQLKYPLYWCKWSENPADFRCKACVEKKLDQTTYNYKNNSILLTVPTKHVGASALGQNIQPTGAVSDLIQHQFGCNGCGGCPSTVGQARYICLGCRAEPNYRGDYIDLCQQCLNKYLEKNEEVAQNLKPDGHQQNHPFLRILYNVKGYYKY